MCKTPPKSTTHQCRCRSKGSEEVSDPRACRETVSEEDWGSDRPSAQAVEKALNEVYDVVCEGRIVGRIMLTNVPAPYWAWNLAYSFHEGRTPTHGHEVTIEAAMQPQGRDLFVRPSTPASHSMASRVLALRRN